MTQATTEHPLRKWRKAKGWTLERCASAIGTSRQVWSDWERGAHKPGALLMPKVRELTGGAVTADHFFPNQDQAA